MGPDLSGAQIVVRNAKGAKDRMVPLPEPTRGPQGSPGQDARPIRTGPAPGCRGRVSPQRAREEHPNAPEEWIWQYVFPERAPIGGSAQWHDPAASRA